MARFSHLEFNCHINNMLNVFILFRLTLFSILIIGICEQKIYIQKIYLINKILLDTYFNYNGKK